MNYPVAEIFSSIQGEGAYVGLPMTFIRLAGCSVGRPLSSTDPLFPVYTRCHPAVGPSFICDTDYRRTINMNEESLLDAVKENSPRVVCLTGGEPLIHDLAPLVGALSEGGYGVHLETSGTRIIPPDLGLSWVSCSPKAGFLTSNAMLVDEFKFLVSSATELGEIEEFLKRECEWEEEELELPVRSQVFLQPVNGLSSLDWTSLANIYKMLEQRPRWQLSVQLHKVLGVR